MEDYKTYLFNRGLYGKNVSKEVLKQAKQEYKKKYFKKYNQEYRTTHIRKECLFTNEQFEKIKLSAKEYKMPVGTFIREALLAYINKKYLVKNVNEINDLILEIKRIGTNINQIAKRVNINGIQSFDEYGVYQNLYKLERVIIDLLVEAKEKT